MRLPMLLPLLAAAACTISPAQGGESAAVAGADSTGITPAALRAHVEAIAHDSMGGRNTPSPGLEAAARYVARALADAGLEPVTQRYAVGGGTAPNVYAILRGSDSTRRDEYVVVSAHMDHVGIQPGGDSIYNGADDNGSGTAALLTLAHAFAAAPVKPARSIIFVAVSGEEQGMWGSAHFVRNPPVPLRQVIADVNVDMIGRNHPDSVGLIGSTYTTLGRVAERVSGPGSPSGIRIMHEPWPEEQFFFRSDHINFARAGIPAIFIHAGVHEDYHEPSDEPETLDYVKAARVTRFVYDLVAAVANDPAKPAWYPSWREKIVR